MGNLAHACRPPLHLYSKKQFMPSSNERVDLHETILMNDLLDKVELHDSSMKNVVKKRIQAPERTALFWERS